MDKFQFTTSSATAAFCCVIGVMAAPQAAMADTCTLVTNTGQPNNYFFVGNDNGYNPVNQEGGSAATPATPSNIACGRGSVVTGTNATTNGSNTTAGQDGTALGQGASATGTGSVALGQGSTDGGVAGVVSLGAVGTERRLINLAAGTNGTDAVNLDQLNLVSTTATTALTNSATALTAATTAQSSATTALSNSATALTAATTAQSTANTALANAATAQTAANLANASISAVQTTVAAQGTAITSLQSASASQTSQINALSAGQTLLSNQITTNNRAANAGIAAAMAMGGTVIPADSKFAMSFNLATYQGEQGFSGSAVAKISNNVYFSAGVAGSTVKGSTGGRAGVTFAW